MGMGIFTEAVDFSKRSVIFSYVTVQKDQNSIGVYLSDQSVCLYVDCGFNESRRVIKYFFNPSFPSIKEYADLNSFEALAKEIKASKATAEICKQIVVDDQKLKTFLEHLDRYYPYCPSGFDIHCAFLLINQPVDFNFTLPHGYGVT